MDEIVDVVIRLMVFVPMTGSYIESAFIALYEQRYLVFISKLIIGIILMLLSMGVHRD